MSKLTLENVIDDVLGQAKLSAEKILNEAEKEAQQIVSKAHVDSKIQLEKFEEETIDTLDEKKNSELSAAKIEKKRMILAAKKMATENIMGEIKRKIVGIDSKKREELTKKLVEMAKKELSDAKYIYSNAVDKKTVEKSDLQFGGTIDCMGGIIVENSTKTVRINLTFDSIFENFKEELNEHISKTFE